MYAIETSKMSSKGQLVVPDLFRKRYGWTAGMTLLLIGTALCAFAAAGVAVADGWRFCAPDYAVLVPDASLWGNENHHKVVNEHFHVLESPKSGDLLAFWTQESFEGSDDMHISFARSRDGGRTWTAPRIFRGSPKPESGVANAVWQLPMFSKSGRLYCFWNEREKPGKGQGVGYMKGAYSDDDGETWSEPEVVWQPRQWCSWQRPLRLAKDGRHLTAVSIFENDGSKTCFMRFENLDDDPGIAAVKISLFMDGAKQLDGEEASIVKLPDGRLFAVMRSKFGVPLWTVSADGGETWSDAKAVVDSDGKTIAHPRSPCPIYDLGGEAAGSGAYFALFCDAFDPKVGQWEGRGPLYRYDGSFDAQGGQPVRFTKREIFLRRSGSSHYGNSCYSSFTKRGDERVLWFPDNKFYLLGKIIRDSCVERADLRGLDAAAAAEALHVVRELGVDGQPAIWNAHAVQFMYPPQFDFRPLAGAVKYRFDVIDDVHRAFAMEAASPTAPLVPVWTNLTENGFVTVTATGVDAAGRDCGISGTRRFWKMPRFRPGTYPAAKRGYLEAALKAYDYVFDLPSTQYFLRNGKPDPDYGLNAYPAKMHAALVRGMVRYAKIRPDRASAALGLAKTAADYLISISVPAGEPLAHFPPTYDNPKAGPGLGGVGPSSQGKNMLLYPAAAGLAYLDLYEACGDDRYLKAADAIAGTYLRLQGEDGTCALKVDQATGRPVNANRAFPIGICIFLERLAAHAGKDEYRRAAARGLDYIQKGPMRDWNWEGQFEDVEPTEKYVNLTKHPPCETALYLLKCRGREEGVRRFAREVLRFAEDQFVCWERPCRADGTGPISKRRGNDDDYLSWSALGVLEQYRCYVPIDASAAKLLRTYAAFWRETGDALALEKARTLADAIVNEQLDNGRIPTFWNDFARKEPKGDWLNCLIASAMALEDFARLLTRAEML